MPNRIIRESINESRGLALVSPFAQDLYKRLITYADDHGRFNADSDIVRSRLYPRELDAVTVEEIDSAMIELVGIEKVRLYTATASSAAWMGETVFGLFPNWTTHQRLRTTKSKHPDPSDRTVNDWALRVAVPVELKRFIFERDRFACQSCKKSYKLDLPTKQAVRLLGSVLHVDHVVPVRQGGRATKENLRLLCASCNLKRQKTISIAELARLAASCGNPPQVAAGCGELPPESESESKRESEARTRSPRNGDPESDPTFAEFWEAYPRKAAKGAARQAWASNGCGRLAETIVAAVLKQKAGGSQLDQGVVGMKYIPHPATWLNQHRWEDEAGSQSAAQPSKSERTIAAARASLGQADQPRLSDDADASAPKFLCLAGGRT